MNMNIEMMIWFLSIEIWDGNINGIYSVFYRSLNKFNVITGDLNIDLNRDNKYARLIQNIISKHGLDLRVNFITRENNNNGTLIDAVLTNDTERVECKPMANEIISDHQTLMINMKNCDNKEMRGKITILLYYFI